MGVLLSKTMISAFPSFPTKYEYLGFNNIKLVVYCWKNPRSGTDHSNAKYFAYSILLKIKKLPKALQRKKVT